jgi:hypothetical protein
MGKAVMQIDESKFTRKRVMVTARLPTLALPDPTTSWVMLEAEDGSGLAVALMGPDSPESRADAARMMKLWNDALDADDHRSEKHPAREDHDRRP